MNRRSDGWESRTLVTALALNERAGQRFWIPAFSEDDAKNAIEPLPASYFSRTILAFVTFAAR